jgi:hypothetical protein
LFSGYKRGPEYRNICMVRGIASKCQMTQYEPPAPPQPYA